MAEDRPNGDKDDDSDVAAADDVLLTRPLLALKWSTQFATVLSKIQTQSKLKKNEWIKT